MATITRAAGALPSAGGTISAAPLTDTFNNIMNFIEGANVDENNVNLTASNGIAGKSTAQTITGLKTFANTSAAAGGIRNAVAIAHQPASGTAAANDGVSLTFLGYDASGNSKTFGETDTVFTTVTAGSEVARRDEKLMDAGTLRVASTLTAKGVLTLGLAGTNTGKLALTGATSGTITINGAAVAGTWTLQLPASGGTNNYALTTDGTGISSWSQISLTAGISGILPTANGGTGIAYFTAAGPTVARVYTFPDAAATVLTSNAAVTVAQGGTGVATLASNGVLYGNGTGVVLVTAQGGANTILIANAGAPSFSAAPTIGTSITCPLYYGGTAVGSTLTLQSTTANGSTDSIVMKTGNNGANTVATCANSGIFITGQSIVGAVTSAFGSELLSVFTGDNGVCLGLKINGTQANITAADIFQEFRSSSGVEASIAGTASAGVIAYNTFTGAHYAELEDETEELLCGMIVVATGTFMSGETEYLAKITKSTKKAQKNVYAVYSSKIAQATSPEVQQAFDLFNEHLTNMENCVAKDDKENARVYQQKADALRTSYEAFKEYSCSHAKGDNNKAIHQVLALGTGVILVTNTEGDFEVGDLIQASDMPGYGERQPDDLIRSCTIAQITEAVVWNNEPEKTKLVACIYTK